MGRIRDLFQNITETKGDYYEKMDKIKDKKDKDLVEKKEIKR